MNSELQITIDEVLPRLSQSLQRKLLYSVELLRKAEKLALAYDSENGFYLAFSGGKDSQCLYHVAKLAGVKFKAHMNLTSVDPPEVIHFVKAQYSDVELIKPKKSIYQAAVDIGILPTKRVRWCCKEFKESAGAGKVTLIGIRHAESSRRAARQEVEISAKKYSGDLEGLEGYRKARNAKKRGRKPKNNREVTIVNADGERTLGCIRGQESLLISPIIEWTNDDVWNFLNTIGVAHCELYDQGWKRIGCIGCPMSPAKQKIIENKHWPHVKRNWIKAIKAIRTIPTVVGGGIIGNPNPREIIATKWLQTPSQFLPKGYLESDTKRANGTKCGRKPSVGGGISGNLTDEQETEIAENIYDWWISSKPYKKWYSDKFQQQDLFDKH